MKNLDLRERAKNLRIKDFTFTLYEYPEKIDFFLKRKDYVNLKFKTNQVFLIF